MSGYLFFTVKVYPDGIKSTVSQRITTAGTYYYKSNFDYLYLAVEVVIVA